jgi:hypothetical protein
MRKLSIFILAASLLIGSGYALAQPQREGPGPQSGASGTPPAIINPRQENAQVMQQLQKTMEQLKAMINKDKMSADDMKKMQDTLNQMQGMMNHLQVIAMVQMYTFPQQPLGAAAPQTQPKR